MIDRPPCRCCGANAVHVRLGVASEINVAAELSVALGAAPARDWRRPWIVLQHELARLREPRTGELSGVETHAALQDLQSFFIHAYHLKDSLKAASPAVGISKDEIEAAITADPDLALLADLANLDKHAVLDRPPRSGDVPVVVSLRAIRAGSGEGGWRLEALIKHNGKTHDGLAVAGAVVGAWNRHLAGWDLI
jgi:hypothetical protein